MEVWAKRLGTSAKSHIAYFLPGVICWFLWSERNNCRHKGEKFRAHNVKWQTSMHLKRLAESGIIAAQHWNGCSPTTVLTDTRRSTPRIKLPMVVQWKPPEILWLKLNIADSFLPPPGVCRRGGVIRDHNGDLQRAFSIPIAAKSKSDAGLITALFGIETTRNLCPNVWIETDSKELVALLNSDNLGPAASRMTMAKIRLLLRSLNWRVSHIPRSGNKIAFHLALKEGEAHEPQLFDVQNCSRMVSSMIRLEKIGLPHIVTEEGVDEDVDDDAS